MFERWDRYLCVSAILVAGVLSSCNKQQSQTPSKGNASGSSIAASAKQTAKSNSSQLLAADLEEFRPGRSKEEILSAIQWRGNFEMAAFYHDEAVEAISYGIFGGMLSEDPRAAIVWAIFVDGKFQKLVDCPKGNLGSIRLGSFDRLVRAVESPSLDVNSLVNKPKPGVSFDVDIGLTVAISPFIPVLLVASDIGQAAAARNGALREQYNASRLRLGMTEADVEATMGAKPLELGTFDAGVWKIYGNLESFNVPSNLHYANVVVLFRDGVLYGIYSGALIQGGAEGHRALREITTLRSGAPMKTFSDLPRPNMN